jgi:hypothetical protein
MTPESVMLDWLAGIGAAGLEELAGVAGASRASANARLHGLARRGLVEQVGLLAGEPPLWLVTARGLRTAGRGDLAAPRVSSSGFAHMRECARAAWALELAAEGRYAVHSERELRVWERDGAVVASAELGYGSRPELHRPDLVLVPDRGLPLAIEVELTVKAPVRLREIIRAWARSRRVERVVYYAAPAPAKALARAIDAEQAWSAVTVLALASRGELGAGRSTSPIPSAP